MSVDLSQHRQAYAFCAYCPKVCRFACPVSDATQKETVSTWAKMTGAYLATEHKLPVTDANAAPLYACTGCMRCRSVCKHQNEVGYALFSSRALAVEAKAEPAGASSTVETFAQHQNPFGRDLTEVVGRFRADAPVRFPLFPGCSTLVKRPEAIDDLLAVGKAMSANFGVSRASGTCCGYPLYAAGHTDAFVEHAKGVARSLSPYPELTVLDPGCAYTFRVVYPRFGVTMPHPVRTVFEVLAERVAALPAKPKLQVRAAFHDPCHLGRGLGQYEEPRALLKAAVKEVIEPQETRDQAHCSGGGGLLPRTMPDTAVEIARRSAERIAHEGETLVTACATSQRMFERAGRPAEDLIALLRRWLES
jgi:Fe-S oxidoreductase